jgi:hypothetical protein
MWNEIPVAHQWSNLYSAYSIDTKLRSLGITDYLNIRLNEEQIFIISQVEHNRWNIEKLLLGFRKPTPEEQKVIDNNDTQRKEYKNKYFVHTDIRPYDELSEGSRNYDRCITAGISLIISKHTQL